MNFDEAENISVLQNRALMHEVVLIADPSWPLLKPDPLSAFTLNF